MELLGTGLAGTLESGDILIEIKPSDEPGISIVLESIVASQFGQQIKKVIRETIQAYGLDRVTVHAVDKGSLDCTIRARMITAILRGCQSEDFRW
jgi:citrate lyase subunit gamma (acyl carrier protein)